MILCDPHHAWHITAVITTITGLVYILEKLSVCGGVLHTLGVPFMSAWSLIGSGSDILALSNASASMWESG